MLSIFHKHLRALLKLDPFLKKKVYKKILTDKIK
jgi:hypothetical protein